jgi:hypothetical protein
VKFEDLFPGTNLFEKVLWVEHVCRRLAHRSPPWLGQSSILDN